MESYPLGMRIGPYEVASRPMIGGMGIVYFCIDHENNDRPVALKTFKPEYLPDRAARDRFLRESTTWVELGRHPHIVRCYSVEYIDPNAFLVLELIAKEQDKEDASLRSWLGQPMRVGRALLFALQIARGLRYAEDKIPGFVHRDLKPENVLVGADRLAGTYVNRLRVTDFGLAAILNDTTGRLKDEDDPKAVGRTHLTRGLLGTPLYMAPEQWKGETVGVYTDVYALGCILYEMLTGKHAAEGRTITELQVAHCGGKLAPLPANLPNEVCDLLKHSLSIQPLVRYQTWREVTRALEAAYNTMTGEAAPEEGVTESDSMEERKQASYSYNAMGASYLYMGKVEVATGYFEKALTIARKVGDRLGEEVALGNLGTAYHSIGDARKAIEMDERQLVIAHDIGDRHHEGAALGNLGLAYKDLGESRKAITFHEKQLVIMREIGDGRGEGAALSALGLAYSALGDAPKTIEFHDQALRICREIGDRRGAGIALGNLGNAYLKMSETRTAIEFYEQQLEIVRDIGDLTGVANSSFNMALAYSKKGEPNHALPFAQEAAQAFMQIGHSANAQRARELVEKLQGGNADSFTAQANPAQAAFEAFQQVESLQQMQAVYKQYPILKDKKYIKAVERIVKKEVPPNLRPAYEQRLAWLKQIAGK